MGFNASMTHPQGRVPAGATRAIEQLTAFALPNPLPIEGDDRREQRSWVVRHAKDVPAEFEYEDVSKDLSSEAVAAVTKARADRGLTHENLGPHKPVIRLVRVDERHVVINIATIRQEEDDAHEYLIAASRALSVLEKGEPIEDIQGIPRRFWRLLLGEVR
jgi:hypothetical protein